MGLGPGLLREFFRRRRRRRRRRRPPEWVFFGEAVSSRLGLRTEISARYRLQMNRTDGPHLFCFHENVRFGEQINPMFCGKSNQFSVDKSNPFLLTHFTHYTYFTHFTHFMNQLAATWAQGPWAWAHGHGLMGPGPAQGPGRGLPMWLLVGS